LLTFLELIDFKTYAACMNRDVFGVMFVYVRIQHVKHVCRHITLVYIGGPH